MEARLDKLEAQVVELSHKLDAQSQATADFMETFKLWMEAEFSSLKNEVMMALGLNGSPPLVLDDESIPVGDSGATIFAGDSGAAIFANDSKAAIYAGDSKSAIIVGESFPVSAEALDSSFCLPIGKAKIEHDGNDVTITAFSKMVGYTLKAVEIRAMEGVIAEIIILRLGRPLDRPTINASVRKTNRLVFVEESLKYPDALVGRNISQWCEEILQKEATIVEICEGFLSVCLKLHTRHSQLLPKSRVYQVHVDILRACGKEKMASEMNGVGSVPYEWNDVFYANPTRQRCSNFVFDPGGTSLLDPCGQGSKHTSVETLGCTSVTTNRITTAKLVAMSSIFLRENYKIGHWK